MRRAFFSPPDFTFDRKVEIGNGAFGKVYLGALTDTKTTICVKVSTNASDNTFEKEFELLAKMLGKEGIIQTHGFYDGGSFRYIVLEKADGTLEHLLNVPRHSLGLPMQLSLDLIGDLGNALTVLSELKIAHRDIKPDNILFFPNEKQKEDNFRNIFKLCDFGMGRSVRKMDATFHTAGGTIPYMCN
ncbi:hypothetical protein PMAYCL1PPCAC_13098 [Pristionchus mayeri]|uniref:IkappaB kinase n=1 Tax=Pristionchus mayeri TaxID=1317129 RepID=A0AAN5C9I2_9BILA|nr:hypothetical protein PMAYCL1PPCAC_13098 [Pristionchus mayeri]